MRNAFHVPISVLAWTVGFTGLTCLAESLTHCVRTPAGVIEAPVDASDAAAKDSADLACQKLKAWECAIGNSQYCAQTFRLPARFGFDPACVLEAGNPADLYLACRVRCESKDGSAP